MRITVVDRSMQTEQVVPAVMVATGSGSMNAITPTSTGLVSRSASAAGTREAKGIAPSETVTESKFEELVISGSRPTLGVKKASKQRQY